MCKRPYREMSDKILTRLYTDAPLSADTAVELGSGPAHKLRAVLRAQTGDDVLVFNGRDGEWRARLGKIGKTGAQAQCLNQTRAQQAEPGPWLVFAPLKKDRLDQIVEKAVELGVERLIPVITRRTENRRLKMERLTQQVIDAAEQCERLTIPEICAPVALDRLAAQWPQGRTLLVAAERRGAQPLALALKSLSGPTALLTGPEGGFEDVELDAVLNLSISIPVGLGPRILRAETAAIAALSVIQSLTGDWAGPHE